MKIFCPLGVIFHPKFPKMEHCSEISPGQRLTAGRPTGPGWLEAGAGHCLAQMCRSGSSTPFSRIFAYFFRHIDMKCHYIWYDAGSQTRDPAYNLYLMFNRWIKSTGLCTMHVGHVPRISPKRGSPAGHLTPGPRVTRHGSSEGHLRLNRNDIYHSKADGELNPKM